MLSLPDVSRYSTITHAVIAPMIELTQFSVEWNMFKIRYDCIVNGDMVTLSVAPWFEGMELDFEAYKGAQREIAIHYFHKIEEESTK